MYDIKKVRECFVSYYEYDPLLCQWIKISESVFNDLVVKYRDQYTMFYVQPNIAIFLLDGFPAYKRVYFEI